MDSKMSLTINELVEKFLISVNCVLTNDLFLLENNVNERTISNKLASYLKKEFQDWDVDTEYNRDRSRIKKRADDSPFTPDIIVHKRGTKNNLIMVEVKKSNGRNNDEENRLKEATLEKYNYKLGVFITFNVLKNSSLPPSIKFYSEGRGWQESPPEPA